MLSVKALRRMHVLILELVLAQDLEEKISYLPGDCLVAAAFLSYAGPFLSTYRNELVSTRWLPEVRRLGVPCSPEFELGTFLVKPTNVRDWNIQGLPNDSFSTENGIIVTRGTRWPLMVDPQGTVHVQYRNTLHHT